MISTDGAQWEITAEWAQPGRDDSNNLMSAVYAQGKFVVVGGGGGGKSAAGHILISADGREWKEVFTHKGRINPVVFGNHRLVVGTSGYPSGRLLWSDDAESWSQGGAILTKGLTHFRGGAYGNGVFVLVGNGGASGERSWAVTTPDGQNITTERDDLPGHGTIVFGADRFLMLTSHTNAELISSTDGNHWDVVNTGGETELNWLVWTGREFFTGNNKSAVRSTDGSHWTQANISAQGQIKWSDGTRFISSSWPGKMAYSGDGKIWKNAPPLTANGINRVVYRPGSN